MYKVSFNVIDKRVQQTSECNTNQIPRDTCTKTKIPSQPKMQHRSDEKDIILAIQAMERDPELSARGAARLYSVDHTTLCRRRRGRLSRRDSIPKSRKLTDLEESTII